MPLGLTEAEFQPLIVGNYYKDGKFYYELDKDQVEGLRREFSVKIKEMLGATNKKRKSENLPQVQVAPRDTSTKKAKAKHGLMETYEELVKGNSHKMEATCTIICASCVLF